jgi:ABC-type cobalamin/Fe3+-siderophores transport system ATPase subunit
MTNFRLSVQAHTEQIPIDIDVGQTLFVLGANGTGKSSLLQRFAAAGGGNVRRISASRQTWFQSSALEFTPAQKQSYEQQVRSWDTQTNSRWMEQNAQMRSGLTLYDLIDAENVDARAIASAMRSGDETRARELAGKAAPVEKINELLALSNISIEISVQGGDRLTATKNGGQPYGAAELSDGERNALLIAADVLTSKSGTLLIIDEPERHLHRSIISPLLTHLFRYRNDCAFVVGTHDLMLPVDNPDARVLLVRSCTYVRNQAACWDVDLIPANADLDESLKQDIVGSRRRIVFVEGEDSSLDKPLYSVLFPGVSVRSKGSSRDVEHAVGGIRSSEALHWVKAWGIIDNDGRDTASIATLQAAGIFALPFYSVESIYYHPDLVLAVARRQATVTGEDGEINAQKAIRAAIAATEPHFERLGAKAVEKSIRRSFFAGIPTLRQIQEKRPVSLTIDIASVVEGEVAALSTAAQTGDWTRILTRCPVRETPALDAIARGVGLQSRFQYESAVLQMLREDEAALTTARALFGALERFGVERNRLI